MLQTSRYLHGAGSGKCARESQIPDGCTNAKARTGDMVLHGTMREAVQCQDGRSWISALQQTIVTGIALWSRPSTTTLEFFVMQRLQTESWWSPDFHAGSHAWLYCRSGFKGH